LTEDGDYLDIPGARKHAVETNSGRAAFIKAGSGPPLILLHGLGTTSETWGPTIRTLMDRFTVLAPDLAGHGQSSGRPLRGSVEPLAQALDGLCAQQELETAAVVGHSLGGLVAIRFAFNHPDRMRQLVLVDAGGIGGEMSWLLRLAAIPLLGRLVFGPSRL
jgi:pimeloyl-ACP methyl ester carboxylesterase